MSGLVTSNEFTFGTLIKTSFRALVISYLITLPAFLIFAALLTFTDFPGKYISSVVLIVTVFSIFCSGFFTSLRLKSKGWISGAFAGLGYMIVLYIISGIALGDVSIGRYVLTMMAIGMITGSIGGIVGINMKGKSRSINKLSNQKKFIPPKKSYKIRK